MFGGTIFPLEFMDLPLDEGHPLVWAVNKYAQPTGRHFDIHAGLEIGIVLAGKSRRLYQRHAFEAQPGDVWLVAPWEPHGVQILQRNTHHLVMGIAPQYLGIPDAWAGCDWMRLFRLPPARRLPRSRPAQRRAALSFASRFGKVLRSDDLYGRARLRIVLQEFLLELMTRAELGDEAMESGGAVDDGANLLEALRMVEEDCGRKIMLADAARAARMSRTRFAERFHSFTGLTFGNYLTRRRLRGVVGELRTTDGKLQTIAERWGFADASHLVRVFRRYAGCTPREYRQRRGREEGIGRAEMGTMPRPRLFV